MDLQVSIRTPGKPLTLGIKICESLIKTKVTVREDEVNSAGYNLQPYTASLSLCLASTLLQIPGHPIFHQTYTLNATSPLSFSMCCSLYLWCSCLPVEHLNILEVLAQVSNVTTVQPRPGV